MKKLFVTLALFGLMTAASFATPATATADFTLDVCWTPVSILNITDASLYMGEFNVDGSEPISSTTPATFEVTAAWGSTVKVNFTVAGPTGWTVVAEKTTEQSITVSGTTGKGTIDCGITINDIPNLTPAGPYTVTLTATANY